MKFYRNFLVCLLTGMQLITLSTSATSLNNNHVYQKATKNDISTTATTIMNKISSDLLYMYDNTDTDDVSRIAEVDHAETLPVMVWFKDISAALVHEKTLETLSLETDDANLMFSLGQFTRNYTQTTKRGLLTTNKG